MVTLVNQFTSPTYLAPRPFPLGPGQTQVTFLRNLLEHCWIVFWDVVEEMAKRAQNLATV